MSEDTGTDGAALAERLTAVERAVTDGAAAPADIGDAADAEARIAATESELADLAERVSELEAATQALRGYVGGVRAVNRDVERRADLALARTEKLTGEDAAADAPDNPDALDARTPDVDALAAIERDDAECGETEGSAREAESEMTDDAPGIARRLRDAL